MKHTKQILTWKKISLIFSALLVFSAIFAQNPQSQMWSAPPYKISFPAATAAPLPSSTNALEYQGQASDYTNNVMHDGNGNLLFFIVDGSVYDKNGRLISDILNPFTYLKK